MDTECHASLSTACCLVWGILAVHAISDKRCRAAQDRMKTCMEGGGLLLRAATPSSLQPALTFAWRLQEEFYEAPLTWAALPQMGVRFVVIGAGSLAVGEYLGFKASSRWRSFAWAALLQRHQAWCGAGDRSSSRACLHASLALPQALNPRLPSADLL